MCDGNRPMGRFGSPNGWLRGTPGVTVRVAFGARGSDDQFAMNDSPLVSVLTPVHNGEDHIAECIESVIAQSHENWEYTIADNCSTDRTPEIIQSFAGDERIRYVRYDEFVDVVASYGRAIGLVGEKCAYMKIVGADDLLYPACLQRMVDVRNPTPRWGSLAPIASTTPTSALLAFPKTRRCFRGLEILRQSLRGGPYVTGSATSVLFRSDLVRRRNPFYDLSFRHADTEAAYWVLAQSEFGFVHEVLTFTRRPRIGETAVATRMGTYWPENIRMLIRYGPNALGEREYQRLLRRELRSYAWLHTRADQALRTAGRRVQGVSSTGARAHRLGGG